MNIEQAKAVSLYDILIKLELKPTREHANQAFFLSPLRDEKTESFHVHQDKNVWYDFGEGKGGSIVDFACAYLKSKGEDHTVSDALRWVDNMSGNARRVYGAPGAEKPYEPKLTLKSVKEINHVALIKYLENRGIPPGIGMKHLKEVVVDNANTHKSIFALGFKNREGGYDLRNSFFKGCVGPKSISFVAGNAPKAQGIHVFEGFMDYLSILADINRDTLDDDAIILNSVSCVDKAAPYFKDHGYKTVWTWLDNDRAGEEATRTIDQFISAEENIVHRPMNDSYKPHKDVNAWLVDKLANG